MPINIKLVGALNEAPGDEKILQVQALPGRTVAQSIYLSGLFKSPALCSGLGSCGQCKVRYLNAAPAPVSKEFELLGESAVEAGWRLGCKHSYAEDVLLELPEFTEIKREEAAPQAFGGNAYLAVDLGTTSIHWQLIENDTVVASGSQINPQMGAGSDVVARLQQAELPGGLELLSGLVQAELRNIINSLPVRPAEACIAGNTAMTALFLGIPPKGLARAPYMLPLAGGREYNLPNLPSVYVPPMLAPFVGGDISAGMMKILDFSSPVLFPFIFSDLGTNGEFVLALAPDKFIACSIPMGPAVEGIGLSCGGLAGVGSEGNLVLTSFKMTSQGLEAKLPLEQASAISGTGYLSLLSILLKYHVVSLDGTFATDPDDNHSPIRQKILRNLHTNAAGTSLRIGQLKLTASDVEELLKVKAAYSLAVKSLLAEGGLQAKDLKKVYLAGALGEHVSSFDLLDLGFLPQNCEGKIEAVGNSSLAGAVLLQDKNVRRKACEFKDSTNVFSLVGQPGFMEKYVAEMRFVY